MPNPPVSPSVRDRVQTLDWPGHRCLLLVHGIGNAKPGDYADLMQDLRECLGPEADRFAIYQLFYDEINDWFAAKTGLKDRIEKVLGFLRDRLDGSDLAEAMVETVGDVLWPVLHAGARSATRELYLAQLGQIVRDGRRCVPSNKDMELNIIAHSLGCYHTYEALHTAARRSTYLMRPAKDGVVFKNVVLMASPVQLIRAVALGLGSLVPRRWSATLDPAGLSIPFEESFGARVDSVRNFVSITGRLDPVGGHFLRQKADWAYMDIEGQKPFVEQQQLLDTGDADLADRLREALLEREAPQIGLNNPHSWSAYVRGRETDLREWLTA